MLHIDLDFSEFEQEVIKNALLLRIKELRNISERMQDLGLHNDLEEELKDTKRVLDKFCRKEGQR